MSIKVRRSIISSSALSDPMTGFTARNGLVVIEDSALYGEWWIRDDFCEAVITAFGPDESGIKRTVMELEVDLARIVSSGRIVQDIDAVLAEHLVEDYRQHQPGIEQGRNGLAHWFKTVAIHAPGNPPPPVALIAQGDLVAVLLDLQPPATPVAFHLPTVFRVTDGLVSEHWGGGVQS